MTVGTRTGAARPGSTAERDHLVQQYLPLVRYVLGRLPVTLPTTLDRDDLFSVGVFGLLHAASSYDPTRGASFKTYAFTAIRGSILDELRRHDPVPRNRRDRLRHIEEVSSALAAKLSRVPSPEELAGELRVTVEELDKDLLALRTAAMLSLEDASGDETLASSLSLPKQIDPSDAAMRQEMSELLARAIGELPDTERKVVILYFHEELLLKEIGRILGVTESRISQILTRAVMRLRQKMKEGTDD